MIYKFMQFENLKEYVLIGKHEENEKWKYKMS